MWTCVTARHRARPEESELVAVDGHATAYRPLLEGRRLRADASQGDKDVATDSLELVGEREMRAG